MVPFSHSLNFPAIGCIHTLEFTATGDRSFLYLFRLLALFSWIGSFLVPVCQRCPIPLRRVLLVAVCQPNFSLLVAVCRLVLDQLCVSSRSRLTFVLWICIPSPSHATKTSVSGVVTSISPPVVDVKSWSVVSFTTRVDWMGMPILNSKMLTSTKTKHLLGYPASLPLRFNRHWKCSPRLS